MREVERAVGSGGYGLDTADVQDITSEVLLGFARTPPRGTTAAEVTSWFKVAIRHALTNEWRKRAAMGGGGREGEEPAGTRTGRIFVPWPVDDKGDRLDFPGGGPLPDVVVGAVEERAQLHAALRKANKAIKKQTDLEDVDRKAELFKRVKIEGASYAEILDAGPAAVGENEVKRARDSLYHDVARYAAALKRVLETDALCDEKKAIIAKELTKTG